jgi:ABC-type transport system involved in multi-copper enzyme maturation permease subunit
MIFRVSRLVRAEFIKLASQPFLYLGLILIAAATILLERLGPLFHAQPETVWRSYHSVQLFAYGFDWGLKIAEFVLVIFSAMMFAGEFDRGTIKNLLTRPITRTDLFAAKCLTVLALGVGLFVFVLYISLAYAFARGDLGPVWLADQYLIQRPYEMIAVSARKAVSMSFLPFIAAGFLGILVSNCTESSGYAVAIALVLFNFGDVLTGVLPYGSERWSFLYYPPYVLDKLQKYAAGGTEHWDESLETRLLFVKVPLAYIAAFLPPAFVIFQRRNIAG